MLEALGRTLFLFRPSKATGYNGKITYTRSILSNCKLAQPSKGWTTDTAGSTRSATATLFFNIGHSQQLPVQDPMFKAGDIITTKPALRPVEDSKFVVQDASNEVADAQGDDPIKVIEFTVQAVTEQFRKNVLHHYEVVLV